MKKIAHIIEAGRFSGPNSTIITITKQLKKDFDFTVISADEKSDKFKSILAESKTNSLFIDLTRLRGNIFIIFRYAIRFFYEIFCLVNILKKIKPDIIHTHTYMDIKGLIAGKILGIPVVWQLHLDIYNSTYKYFFKLFKSLHKGHFICVSNITSKNFIPNIEKSRISVIQSGIDSNHFFKESTNNKTEIIKIASIGNYHFRKGFELILKIANEFKKENITNVQFHILGKVFDTSTDYFNSLKEQKLKMQLNNVFLHTSDENGIKNFLTDKSIFLMTSIAEASPFVAWESASMGLPIISTDVGDLDKFLKNYKSGYIIDNRDPIEFYKKIKKYILNKNFYHNHSKNARKMVVENFDSVLISEQYKDCYIKLLKKNKYG